jgi:preprotein translocase subunit SecG
MSFIAGILTFILVINCLVLILLILIQLPKKDAGAGLAFGGGAADALFGAGSGNVLTKVTKWATVLFFVMALGLGTLQDHLHKNNSVAAFEKRLEQKQMQMPIASPQPITPPASQPASPPATPLLSVPPSAPTNVPEAPAQSK